ncbi:hypothetical protein [Nonomuraea fuscirosea]|uniref:hypothetical protein n=1 Tax=Nonomuraea fuscirosea TaxID=1291556 RepID=UPI0033F7D97E
MEFVQAAGPCPLRARSDGDPRGVAGDSRSLDKRMPRSAFPLLRDHDRKRVPKLTVREDALVGDPWGVIDDHIVGGRVLPALMIMRDQFDDTIHEAIDRFAERYEYLREARPDDFTKPREEYGRGFYS